MVTEAELHQVERWFVGHGLPYFVDDIRAQVQARLGRGRLLVVLSIGLLIGAVAGVTVGLLTDEVSYGVSTGANVVLGLAVLYALQSLRAQVIAGWALRRAFRSLGLLLPLLTRALPMLLLFITFLFINAEVWQVSASLDGGVLWGAVLFFGVAAVLFLVPRLAEELDAFDDSIVDADLMLASKGTPLEAAAQRLVDQDIDLPEEAQVSGLQMVNLVLVLVIAQAVQVLLLAVAVFGFFIVFGAVAINDDVILSWTGEEAYHVFGFDLVSEQLVQVSVFLAAFSGLYFTVYAITDELYRKEFFTVIMNELRRAVGARVIYRALRREADGVET
ncbi:MAG: hypothetical protein M3237_20440 [Actinomycetota bacterium]|nr:hypothetical protein [Actinomycetota bacterium]